MGKRQRLNTGQSVVVIYHSQLGFVEIPATFIEYRSITLDGISHDIPFFSGQSDWFKQEISGLDCFWLLAKEAANSRKVEKYQYDVIKLQFAVSMMKKEKQLNVPEKFKDQRIKDMANQEFDKLQHLISKLGFDPRDQSWVEQIAESLKERQWFKFEKEYGAIFSWPVAVVEYNRRFNDQIAPSTAKAFSKKRMRYLLGAHHIQMQGTGDVNLWRQAAKDFEKKHSDREQRMEAWSKSHEDAFPMVKTRQPIEFYSGPYHSIILETIPDYFTNAELSHIAIGITLRVVSYDPQGRYIRLDFLPEVRSLIKKNAIEERIWDKEEADYEFLIFPHSIEDSLEILQPLT